MRDVLQQRLSSCPSIRWPFESEHPVSRSFSLTVGALAIVLGAAAAAIAPLSSADDHARGLVLRAIAPREPPLGVLVISVTSDDLKSGACERSLPSLLESGNAQGALLVPPVDAFCGHSSSLPLMKLPADLLRLDERGELAGFNEPGPDPEVFHSIGVTGARYIVPARLEGLPSIALRDLDSGRVGLSMLGGRVAVIGMEDAVGSPVAPALRVASSLGGLLEGGRREEAPAWIVAIVAALFGAVIGLSRRLFGAAGASLAFVASLLALVALQLPLAALTRGLLPLASIALGLSITFAGALALELIASMRTGKRASELGVSDIDPEVDASGARCVVALSTGTLMAPTPADPSCPFSLNDLVAEAAMSTWRVSGRTMSLELSSNSAYAIGHRVEVACALDLFLLELAMRGLPGQAPALSVRDEGHDLEVLLTDASFGLGLPEPVLQRVLMDPSAPPSGLEALGRLVSAVENGRGSVTIESDESGGLTLVVSFVRAASETPARLSASSSEGRVSGTLPKNVIPFARKRSSVRRFVASSGRVGGQERRVSWF